MKTISSVFVHPMIKKLPILEIVDYISKHYQNLTLKQTANYFGFNSSYLSFIIKENTGKNFSDIVKEIKLSQACKALKNTQLSIAEICEIIGYNNPEYFMKLFKKEFGLTAGEYRNKYSN
jgi:YesN/AraC family two-component response regulator